MTIEMLSHDSETLYELSLRYDSLLIEKQNLLKSEVKSKKLREVEEDLRNVTYYIIKLLTHMDILIKEEQKR